MAHDARDALEKSNGARTLPLVQVDTYNEEIRDGKGWLGDRACNRAFRALLEGLRKNLRGAIDADPLGEKSSHEISKKKLDHALIAGDPLAGGLVLSAIESFAQELAFVARRLLKRKAWAGTQRIVVGGGLRQSRIGELAIGRAAVMVREAGHDVDLLPIRHHPDEAGLIGATQLAPPWIYREHNAMLAVDIGGSNIRAGVIDLRDGLDQCRVVATKHWRHADEEEEPARDEAIERLIVMLLALARTAKRKKLSLMPLIGIGCPGVIQDDGRIDRGAQNLPGNWESIRFNLADRIKESIPLISGEETRVLVHNDAIVQGLSEAPFMRDVERWGVFTIGTGLGNARFTNLAPASFRPRAPWSPWR